MTVMANESNWKALVENNQLPVIVDFWAEWCGSCVSLVGPLMDQMDELYKDRIVVAKVNVDENPSIATRYGVRNVPTILFFKEGQVLDKLVGSVPKNQMIQKIEAQIS